jgi:hypothetical protein
VHIGRYWTKTPEDDVSSVRNARLFSVIARVTSRIRQCILSIAVVVCRECVCQLQMPTYRPVGR